MPYGFRAYCQGIEVATSVHSGLVFPLIKGSGNSIAYNIIPNQFSQVEFVLSPLMGFWRSSQSEVAKQFNFPTSRSSGASVDLAKNDADVANLMLNSGRTTQVRYENNHVTQAEHAVVGLSNTIGANSTKYNQRTDKYGIFCQDSIVNIATQVDSYKLYATEFYVGSTTSHVLSNPHDYINMRLGRNAVVFFVPCNATSELLAVCPENYASDVSIALYAQTPIGCIYLMYTNDIKQRLKVYRYKLGYQQPQGVGYGIRIRNNQGNVTFDTRLPPLIPLFVSNSEKLNGVQDAPFPLAVVFSRVDTLFNMDYIRGNPYPYAHQSFNLTNGVTWQSSRKIQRAFMGIAQGKWVDDAILDAMFARNVGLAIPFLQRSGLTKNVYQNSGVFLGVVAY